MNGSYVRTPEIRARMSQAQMGNKNATGGKSNRGRKFSPSHRAKIAAALRGNQNSLGRKRGPETIARMSAAQSGERGSNWQGGRRKTDRGYVLVWSPTHPLANSGGYVMEHRLVMEAHLGQTLLPTEVVHHINGARDDNRIDNLMLFHANAEHINQFHGQGTKK